MNAKCSQRPEPLGLIEAGRQELDELLVAGLTPAPCSSVGAGSKAKSERTVSAARTPCRRAPARDAQMRRYPGCRSAQLRLGHSEAQAHLRTDGKHLIGCRLRGHRVRVSRGDRRRRMVRGRFSRRFKLGPLGWSASAASASRRWRRISTCTRTSCASGGGSSPRIRRSPFPGQAR
jgi:hypothetical protein